MGKTNVLGAWGEALAADYLKKKRYQILSMGYRSRYGEIDLVVKNKKQIVFVEVKLRKSASFAEAHEYVNAAKQRRLITTASFFLSQNPTDLPVRFDVIEIYAPDGTQTVNPEIRHMEDAFR